MKGKRVHVVPLTAPMKDFLVRLHAFTGNRSGYLFEGNKRGNPISEMTMTKVLRDADLAWRPHGFRSSFRDWVSEETAFDGETAEQALAHVVANKTEAAYRRGNQLEKRRVMMAAWNDYCLGGSGNVVRLVG
jgi:integrase